MGRKKMNGDTSMNALADLLQNQGDMSHSYIKKFMDVKQGLQNGLMVCGSNG